LANRMGVMQASMPPVMLFAALPHARLELLQGTPDTALAFLESQVAHARGLGLDRVVAYMLAEQVRILLDKGERARAADASAPLNELGEVHREADGSRAEIPAVAALARARVALAGNDPKGALAALAVARDFGQRYGRGRTLLMVQLLSALAWDDLKREDETSACLVDAVQAGARHGFVRSFLDEGPRMGVLLARSRGDPRLDEAAVAHLDDVLGRFESANPSLHAKAAASGGAASAPPDVKLTPRELEILSLVSQAMSNKRIALTLNISLDTVKWNVRNILTKLGLSSRYDAMTWARKQGLIR